jgi:hypothetical protein
MLLFSDIGLRRSPAFLTIRLPIATVSTLKLLASVFFHLLGEVVRSHNDTECHLVGFVGTFRWKGRRESFRIRRSGQKEVQCQGTAPDRRGK